MCGIAGFYDTSVKLPFHYLEKMAGCLQHRGPDAAGFFHDEITGFAHRRLSIIDLSEQANQPMLSASGKHVIIFNGEIYNYNELAKEFKIPRKTSSDTEVLVELFEKLGPEFIEKVNGMFAIAIYSLIEKKLYLFRDRLGIKPLYYTMVNGSLFFASELKALKKIDIITKQITVNPDALNFYLHLGFIPEPYSIYKQISKFPSGHYACFDKNKADFYAYWKPEEKVKPAVYDDFWQARQQLKELLESSVRYRLISDVPYGTFLSGGIDSSLITAIACRVDNKPVSTFTIGFHEDRFNEALYAKAIARYLGTQHHEFYLSYKDAIEIMPAIPAMFDEPFADSSAVPTFLVSKMAKQHVTMTLSGDGGDELFMGYGAHIWAKRLSNPFVRARAGWAPLLLNLTGNRGKRAAWLFRNDNPQWLKSHILSQEMYFFSRTETEHLTGNKTANWNHINPSFDNLNRKLLPHEQQALFDLKYYLKDDLLVKVDRSSMQNSLETRVPFLDYRLVEFALNLPAKWKLNKNTGKWMLKNLLEDYLPRDLFNRPKKGFSIPLEQWMRKELRIFSTHYLSQEITTRFNLVNHQIINKLTQQFYQKKHAYLYLRLWQIIVLHRWAEENL